MGFQLFTWPIKKKENFLLEWGWGLGGYQIIICWLRLEVWSHKSQPHLVFSPFLHSCHLIPTSASNSKFRILNCTFHHALYNSVILQGSGCYRSSQANIFTVFIQAVA
eukprot:TRINITY_DN4148_c0_g1_i15.p1 TRINITY_DN4148_c0_g1~~TRINITY_DN4148_c0_g1_i15.p1  ORF type:complete len:108 (+),score=3.47 TRINITY_DN4148_c0_g1_i15:657-980(+)